MPPSVEPGTVLTQVVMHCSVFIPKEDILQDQDQDQKHGHKELTLYKPVNPNSEFDNLQKNYDLLQNCDFFHSELDRLGAKKMLSNSKIGTFLLRTSSDPMYLFSLSIRTEKGPTSVRVKYSRGLFQLDCEERVKKIMPRFDNVVALVDFHTTLSKSDEKKQCRWVEHSGSKRLTVNLNKPLLLKPSSLKHMCRLKINGNLKDLHIPQLSTDRLEVPTLIKDYLRQYPYKV